MMFRDRTGHVLWGTNTWHTKQVIEDVKAGETIIIFEMTFECLFGPGSYSVSPALTNVKPILTPTTTGQTTPLYSMS